MTWLEKHSTLLSPVIMKSLQRVGGNELMSGIIDSAEPSSCQYSSVWRGTDLPGATRLGFAKRRRSLRELDPQILPDSAGTGCSDSLGLSSFWGLPVGSSAANESVSDGFPSSALC